MSQSVQVIRTPADLSRITFEDGVAALEVRITLLDRIRFKNWRRGRSGRLSRLVRSIGDHGFNPAEPIIARVGRRGKWVVIDGGHRVTALKRLTGGFFARLLRRDYGYMYVILFTGPRSAPTASSR